MIRRRPPVIVMQSWRGSSMLRRWLWWAAGDIVSLRRGFIFRWGRGGELEALREGVGRFPPRDGQLRCARRGVDAWAPSPRPWRESKLARAVICW